MKNGEKSDLLAKIVTSDSLVYVSRVCGGGANKYEYRRPKNHRIYKSLHPLNIGYGDNNFDHVNICIFHNIFKSNFVRRSMVMVVDFHRDFRLNLIDFCILIRFLEGFFEIF